MGIIFEHDNDFADLYFQSSQHESWVLEDGIIKDGSYNIERGVGVRAVSGEKTGFAYSDDISTETLNQAAKAARSISRQGSTQSVLFPNRSHRSAYNILIIRFLGFEEQEKIALLKAVDAYIRAHRASGQSGDCQLKWRL